MGSHARKQHYEWYHDNDMKPVPGTPTSYDILAQHCGSSAATLKSCAKIGRLQPTCKMYENIDLYVKNSADGKSITVQNIYKVSRKGEAEPTEPFRILLWHGTSAAAVSGIIQTGFQKGSGGLYGGGIYFADRIAKSYGYARTASNGNSFFILAEISPGKVYKAHHYHSDYKSAPPGFDSVKGMGSNIPTWKQNKNYKGAILPCGVSTANPRHTSYDMPFNEYILYDANRIIVRFIVECKFNNFRRFLY
ncbi:Poly [ADP-ribose] polymerase 1 [Orchesella cincta]|uniref:Poly [ADP-ribose] polymerase n=1 Tax=Orchesella cincta TaxID=48709 RepID=A0A1D2MAS6_ORCCI|nr:Poly [ADP-ribose] polymerase 1 [Orchesella cincta]